jgi:predicted  nucleic acid-binding Zn-ribbon protein
VLKQIEQLLILQDRDRKIRSLKQEIKMAPEERQGLEERLVSETAQLEAVKQKFKELEMGKKKLELDAQSRRDSIAKFRTQQFQTRKNEEFQALSNEIKRFEAEITSIEDNELDLMEQAEKAKAEVAEGEKAFAAAKNQINQQLADMETKAKTIDGQLKELEVDRENLAKQLDEDLLERYNRLFASKGDAAVVPLEHEVCMGCHMKITTQTAVRVKADQEILSCEQCGRILYHES